MPWHKAAVEFLLEVGPRLAAAVPDVAFAVVGGGPDIEELRLRAQELGLGSRVRFTGAVARDRVAHEVREFDVGVIPAIFDYAFPVKLVEMGAAGLPVVAPQSDDLDEMLRPGLEYEPFRPGDAESFVSAVTRVLREPDLRARLGANLHAAVRERYTWDSSAKALGGVLAAVLRNG